MVGRYSKGVVPADTTKYDPSATVPVKGNTGSPSRTGFTFNGWNNLQDGTGKTYRSSDTLVIGMQDIQLYAQWTIDSVIVSFNSNGGSAVASKIVAYRGYVTEPAVPTKAGYVFAGWFSNQSLTTAFDFLTPITVSRVLYAKWNPVYRVVYNANGASGQVPVDNNEYQSGQIVTLLNKPAALTKQYYDFVGWNTARDGVGTNRMPGTTFQIGSKNDTLYANWQVARPVISAQPTGLNPYPLDNISFSVTAEGIGLSYQWQKDGTDIQGANSSLFAKQKVTFSDSGYYRCVVSTVSGSTTSSTVKLTVRTTMKDADSNEYPIVVIGNQVWTAENLRTTKFNDGSDIRLVESDSVWLSLTTPAYCFYNNSSSLTEHQKWGALYNWYSVNSEKFAPKGWHVPSDEEWIALENYLDISRLNIGKSLAAKTDWTISSDDGDVGNDLTKNNQTSFSALPGGYRSQSGYIDRYLNGYWWGSTEFTDVIVSARAIYYDDWALGWGFGLGLKYNGFSVRLVRD